jgi:Trk K+ transport system NAD-binding subunit
MPHHADAKTILTVFTIRAHLEGSRHAATRKRPVYVVAEILDSENVEHAYTAGADEVIETRRLGFSLLSHAVTMPGTAALMSAVASTGAHSIFIGEAPDGYSEEMTFGELARMLKAEEGVLLIGVREPDSGDDWLNPPDDHVVEKGTRLLYLAESACLPGNGE